MANGTQSTKAGVIRFLNAVADPDKRVDCRIIARMMRAATGKPTGIRATANVDEKMLQSPIEESVARMQDKQATY